MSKEHLCPMKSIPDHSTSSSSSTDSVYKSGAYHAATSGLNDGGGQAVSLE